MNIKMKKSDNLIPMIVLEGKEPGKTVLITAGIHSTEYVGIQSAVELSKEIPVSRLKGRVIILPSVNYSGFAHRTQGVCLEDGKDLYQVFPGSYQGTEAEKIAASIARLLVEDVDYYIDLHGGDRFEALIPHVYWVKSKNQEVSGLSLEMAKCVDVEYRIEITDDCAGAAAWAASKGIPSILIERGGMGIWSREEVKKQKQDIYRILKYLGILKSTEKPERFAQAAFKNYDSLTAKQSGLWYPLKKPGDAVYEGDIVGYVKDIYGEILSTEMVDKKGIILFQIGSLNVVQGDLLVAYTCY